MKSRYGIWLITICWMGLAGCATWQDRARSSMTAPGNAATLNMAPANQSAPPILEPNQAPGMNTPPPPFLNAPPPPAGAPTTAPPPRLNLAAPATASPTSSSPIPDRMYNIEKPRQTASVSKKSTTKSSTISKLASKAKAEPAKKTTSAPETGSTLKRLAADVGKPAAAPEPAPEPKTASAPAPAPPALPAPENAPAPAQAQQTTDDLIDAALLAQPVRKGASTENKNDADGPQSNLLPNTRFFKNNNKPTIYPVSNPAVEEPVDITQFS